MKHLKLFNDTASYEAWKNSEDYVLPNVTFTEDGSLYYNAYVEPASPNIVAVYNVTQDYIDNKWTTKLFEPYAIGNITTMIVDGVETEVDNYYEFDTAGLHTIEYVLDDNTTTPQSMFYSSYNLVSISIPSTIITIAQHGAMGLVSGDVMNTLTELVFHSKIAPTPAFVGVNMDRVNGNGVLKYPKGSDYSAWVSLLPESWTYEEF